MPESLPLTSSAPGEIRGLFFLNFTLPLLLHLPQMYSSTETMTAFDRIEKLYYATRNLFEQNYAVWDVIQ
ncbi:MAG: hypothetical protein BroJett011_72780 [Chloroflexota bacterium]|nr:MAG: hypothetical protein BroJett011_72780 [Chloroflexota bacterium]